MKIIRKRNPPQERSYEATCASCDCMFEFQQKEAKYKSDQRDGDFLSIDCPTCKKQVIVNPKR